MIEDDYSSNELVSLMSSIYQHFDNKLPDIQFELGKCITEMAGGILTKVLSVREIALKKILPSNEVDTRDKISIILDTCIGELSSPHVKPLLYYSFTEKKWELMQPGNIQLWGRTCMEFDKLSTSISLPKNIKNICVGDYFLFAASGAYDMSMSYDFGDGISRNIFL